MKVFKAKMVYVILLLFVGVFGYAGKSQGESLLQISERFRSPWNEFQMKTLIEYEVRGEAKEESFSVFIKDYNKALIGYLEPESNRGNLLLMVDDNLWFYAKKTRKAMRITPIQRLAGGTSYGDITRLSWSRDYEVLDHQSDSILINDKEMPCHLLKLRANSKGATYHVINLWIEKETSYPRRADVFYTSGTLAKTMYFTKFELVHNKIMNQEIKFVDHLNRNRETRMKFSEITPTPVPSRYFLKTQLPALSGKITR